jgi:tripartite-type tricarboxylate transporter receptor subunit TctC
MHAQVLGGHIDAMFEEFGSTISLLEKGDINALVVFKEDRVKDKRFLIKKEKETFSRVLMDLGYLK